MGIYYQAANGRIPPRLWLGIRPRPEGQDAAEGLTPERKAGITYQPITKGVQLHSFGGVQPGGFCPPEPDGTFDFDKSVRGLGRFHGVDRDFSDGTASQLVMLPAELGDSGATLYQGKWTLTGGAGVMGLEDRRGSRRFATPNVVPRSNDGWLHIGVLGHADGERDRAGHYGAGKQIQRDIALIAAGLSAYLGFDLAQRTLETAIEQQTQPGGRLENWDPSRPPPRDFSRAEHTHGIVASCFHIDSLAERGLARASEVLRALERSGVDLDRFGEEALAPEAPEWVVENPYPQQLITAVPTLGSLEAHALAMGPQ